jgi:hypothetical protein
MLGLPPQQNKILQELGIQEPKLKPDHRFSWMSITGTLRALDWCSMHLFTGISWFSWLLSQDMAALYYITSWYSILGYIAVTAIIVVLLEILVASEYLHPIFFTHIPYFTISASIILYGLIQPASISSFLTSMNPLSLICISVIAITLWRDSQMNSYAELIHMKHVPFILITFLFVSKDYLFCFSMNCLFLCANKFFSTISQTPWLSSTYAWYFTPHLPITGFDTDPKPLNKIWSAEIKSKQDNAQTNTPQQDHPRANIIDGETLGNMYELD